MVIILPWKQSPDNVSLGTLLLWVTQFTHSSIHTAPTRVIERLNPPPSPTPPTSHVIVITGYIAQCRYCRITGKVVDTFTLPKKNMRTLPLIKHQIGTNIPPSLSHQNYEYKLYVFFSQETSARTAKHLHRECSRLFLKRYIFPMVFTQDRWGNVNDSGKNYQLLLFFTKRDSSLCPGYIYKGMEFNYFYSVIY